MIAMNTTGMKVDTALPSSAKNTTRASQILLLIEEDFFYLPGKFVYHRLD